MSQMQTNMDDFHWMIDMIQTLDVGLVVLDKSFKVCTWNTFMEAHSGLRPDQTQGKNLFELFDDLPEQWLKNKINSVFMLNNRAFTTWEQRPYVFKFGNYRPITGTVDFMYQNITIVPLTSLTGEVTHVYLIVYDVTDMATNKLSLEGANEKLSQLSRTDGLTNLYNHHYWEERAEQEFLRNSRSLNPCTLVIFDIDHFKRVNDTYGHPAGDEVLRQTAEVLRSALRKTDIAGRYGGEEFALILVDTNSEKALAFCERLRKAIEALKVVTNEQLVQFTISIGLCELSANHANYQSWIKAADDALYQSKETGRNKTSAASLVSPT
jgi:diguanylate cyclase (GGDEF)-like protein/PAS domain S-box-containing protein